MASGQASRRVLYISYDGVLEPLGESQVVAYLERLTSAAAITLLSFEKPADLADRARMAAMRRRLEDAGISWIARRYTKRPPVVSTLFDIIVGRWIGCRWARSGDAGARRIVHARGYVPALVALGVKRASGAGFLFDMRGFWVDEKVEAGHWRPNALLYRVGKWCERRFIAEADAIVSLTRAGVQELPKLGSVREGIPVEVIPTCADLERFAPVPADAERRRELGLDGRPIIGYAGTMSNWYLRHETLSYLAWLAGRFDQAQVFVVTREDHERLREDAVRSGLPSDRLVLARASFDQMPGLIRLMDVGVFFIRRCFSKRASAATKLAEFLGCGVPVVINDGIGDSGEIVRSARAGVVLPGVGREHFDRSAIELQAVLADPGTPVRCRETAAREFDLTSGATKYAALYQRL